MKNACRFLFISTVIGWALSQDGPIRAVLSIAQGEREMFMGETVTLSCTIPGDPSLQWRHLWLKDGTPFDNYAPLDDRLTLKASKLTQSGQYSCQGIMTSDTQERRTLPSHPLQISVAAGWVILLVSPQPAFIGSTVTLTCRVRRDPLLTEVVFYKDDVELQRSVYPKLHLKNIIQEDQGSYWCRATWGRGLHWTTAQSLATTVSVVDLLSQPVLEAVPSSSKTSGQVLLLSCRAQLRFPQPGQQLIYNFWRNGRRLGVSTSRSKITVPLDFGVYQCKVMVGGLGLTKWSNKVPVDVLNEQFGVASSGPKADTLPISQSSEYSHEMDSRTASAIAVDKPSSESSFSTDPEFSGESGMSFPDPKHTHGSSTRVMDIW
ncbi:hypothetical protein GJAV_G00053300 [Gymnothorax javanicus]|nr:hypothetical protein GJAV_G00053300 [Gymnothorax javanicus]